MGSSSTRRSRMEDRLTGCRIQEQQADGTGCYAVSLARIGRGGIDLDALTCNEVDAPRLRVDGHGSGQRLCRRLLQQLELIRTRHVDNGQCPRPVRAESALANGVESAAVGTLADRQGLHG